MKDNEKLYQIIGELYVELYNERNKAKIFSEMLLEQKKEIEEIRDFYADTQKEELDGRKNI